MTTSTRDSPQLDSNRLVAPSFEHALAFWWALTWRSLLWTVGPLVVLWVPLFGWQLFGAYLAIPEAMFRLLGYAIGAAVQMYVVREIMDKEFRKFKVCVVTRT
ncbi:MAG: hypothetical protein ACRD5F_13765 [Candidatus Acidiferrales bacterium]